MNHTGRSCEARSAPSLQTREPGKSTILPSSLLREKPGKKRTKLYGEPGPQRRFSPVRSRAALLKPVSCLPQIAATTARGPSGRSYGTSRHRIEARIGAQKRLGHNHARIENIPRQVPRRPPHIGTGPSTKHTPWCRISDVHWAHSRPGRSQDNHTVFQYNCRSSSGYLP